jgi:polyribonucleotide nucleotidyltransferase
MNVHKVSTTIGERELSIETGKLAKQADGAVLVKYGETVVLVTACAAKEAREGLDFFPLTVDYRENFYAAGKIPGGFFKREGKPSEREVLNSRMIDRPIRPLFPDGYHNETQVVALVLSADPDVDPSMHAIVGASTALFISPIPFTQPIAAVRVGLIDGRYYLNPSYSELKNSRLNLAVAGMEDGIVMVEAGANEVSEEVMVEALNLKMLWIRASTTSFKATA